MWISNLLNSNTGRTCFQFSRYCSSSNFLLKRVLVLSKRTRYELEKMRRPGVSDKQLEKIIRKRGSDFETLIKHHALHKEFHKNLLSEFRHYGIEVESVNRGNYTEDAILWADAVVPAGGDGTFLLAASKVTSRDKPVIGFNSDPTRSEGYLCLPKSYSHHLGKAIQKIIKNQFTWMFRNRIQVELTGPRANEESLQLDECPYPKFNHLLDNSANGEEKLKPVTKVLPYLALNEVFLGESLSSQVSYFEVKLSGYPRTKVKCSGLCVCTGTGSTSWHLSINRLSPDKVKRLLSIAGISSLPNTHTIAQDFNSSLIFPPDDARLHYTLRDQIVAGVWPDPPGLPSEAFTIGAMSVISKCTAANLVIDGGWCYPFNDGTMAKLTLNPNHALRTVSMS